MSDFAFDMYKAPQFVDFKNEEYFDDSADAYFDMDHENSEWAENTLKGDQTNYLSPTGDIFQEDLGKDPLTTSYEDTQPKLRKSMSVGNLILFSEQSEQNHHESEIELCKEVKSLQIDINPSTNKQPLTNGTRRPSYTKKSIDVSLKRPVSVRTSAPKLYRPMSRENLDRLAQPKRYTSVENLSVKTKFVSMAESLIQFQNRTPKRFRSRPDLIPPLKAQPLQRTVPQSPALQTKILAQNRFKDSRIPSYEERVQMEFDKEQKFKIKAHPVNKKILCGPLKPTMPAVKISGTVQEPFHLTEMAPRKPEAPPKKYEFHAQPMPKYSLEKPKKIEVKKKTEPVTPSFMKHYKKEMVKKHESQEALHLENHTSDKPLQRTKPKPFSFEQRDKQVQAKKEQLVNKFIQEEKRAREFHAKPAPKFILKRSDSSKNTSANSCGSSRTSQENLLQPQFRARPPTVLYKEPFVPQKLDRPYTEIQPFALTTENRAHEREEFEREKKEKEARLEIFKKMDEIKQKEQEQKEIARIRKEAEIKANPVRKYKELNIVSPKKVTMPVTPRFETDRIRKRENKENMSNNI